MVKSTMTGTVTSSGRGGTAAAMAQNEQTTEEHSTLEQQPPGRLDHPAWCVVFRSDNRRQEELQRTGASLRGRRPSAMKMENDDNDNDDDEAVGQDCWHIDLQSVKSDGC